jgi:hypothetical protein
MYTCLNCDVLTDDEFTIEVGVNPDETVGLYDFEFVLCSDCEQRRQDGAEEEFKQMAKERAREKAREEEGVELN